MIVSRLWTLGSAGLTKVKLILCTAKASNYWKTKEITMFSKKLLLEISS